MVTVVESLHRDSIVTQVGSTWSPHPHGRKLIMTSQLDRIEYKNKLYLLWMLIQFKCQGWKIYFDALYIIQVGDPEYDIVVESIAGAGDERTNHAQKNLGLTLTDKPILMCTLYRVLIVGEEGLSLLFNFNLPDMKRTKWVEKEISCFTIFGKTILFSIERNEKIRK